MNRCFIREPLSEELIREINKEASKGLIITFESTKGLKTSDLEKIDPNVTISITGALDPKKSKFNNYSYQERTYYSIKELIEIIKKFETIERGINPLWNDFEKMMFVYKSLCEYSNYEENKYNGRDAARNLLGMITGKSVCSGYAVIFKEAMDRLGINCFYQNRSGHHSWNIVEIDGKYHSIELTWDTYDKKDNECLFNYFCRTDQKAFYSNSHHDLSGETEEKEFPVSEVPVSVLKETYRKITKEKVFRKDISDETGKKEFNVQGKEIVIRGTTPFLKSGDSLNTFVRKDGSTFLLLPTGKSNDKIIEYVIVECSPKVLSATTIYSEMDLLTDDQILRCNIADNLLSRERLRNKINNFNGYVGYVVKNSGVYYNKDIEEELNIYR